MSVPPTSETPPSPVAEPPGSSNLFVSGLIGLGIAVVCLVPPVLHFVTGPLGPAIGGFVGGYRARATPTDAALIGGMIGVGAAIAVAALAGLLAAVMPIRLSGEVAAFVLVGVLAYGAILGWGGALLGGRWARSAQRDASSASS